MQKNTRKRHFNNFLIVLSAIMLPLMACMVPATEMPEYSRELARVDDMILEEETLRFKLRLELGALPEGLIKQSESADIKDNPDFQMLLDAAFEKLITDQTIIAYGHRKGIQISDEELSKKLAERKKRLNPKAFDNLLTEKKIPYVRWKKIVENEIQVQYIMDQELLHDVAVSTEEIRSYYRKNQDEFVVPERVRVRQIVTDTLEKAREVHARLLAGENFAQLAVNHSQSPDRIQGGDLGFFARGTYPKEFDEVCFNLKKGEISPVAKSDYGYHVFKLLDSAPAGKKTLFEVSAQIYQKLFEEKLKTKYDVWIAEVKKQVKITINKEVLESFHL